MGVLPVEFLNGDNSATYAIAGDEKFEIRGRLEPLGRLTLLMTRTDGTAVSIPVLCRLDTAEEVSVYNAGGILQRFAQDFLENQS